MKKNRFIKYNGLLIRHEEIGIMINSIVNKIRMDESKIEFTPYKKGLWNLIEKTINTSEKGESLEMIKEDYEN